MTLSKLIKGELPALDSGNPIIPLLIHFVSDINQVIQDDLVEFHNGVGKHAE